MKKNNSAPKKNSLHNKWNILLVIAILSISLSFFYYKNHSFTKVINEKQLAEMLHKGEVKRVVLMKKEDYVKIQLTQKAFYQKKHHQERKELAYLTEEDTHYILKIVNPKVFDQHWQAIQANIKPSHQIDYEVSDSVNIFKEIGNNFGFILFILFLLFMLGSGTMRGRNNIFSIGKSKAISFDKESQVNITFNDVKGIPEAKQEVKEIIDFLKNPEKYTKLGGRMPKGVLLIGSPGSGKTLLAKAVAGEANVPFFYISGSDFVEMFVGVGASRVRDLFSQAKKAAPCIIFIDEIDAVGRARGKANFSSNEERDQTLNALLTEMDGFSETNIIILAATNRPEVLDSALKRPGRFDRQVVIDKPTLKGREEIFQLYLKKIKVATEVSAKRLAEQTAGFTGADIANICNRAALIAGKKNKKRVHTIDCNEAIDQIIGGLEKKDKLIDAKEKKIVAYHEAGHAVAGWFLEHANPLVKVSIIPRGIGALGYAQYLPKEKLIWQKKEMLDELCALLGGKASEEIFFNDLSTGAQNDLEVATHLTYNMIALYGMSEEVGSVSFRQNDNGYTFGKPYSEATGQIIDKTVRTLIENQYQRTLSLVKEKKATIEKVAQKLLEREVLYPEDLEKLIGEKPVSQKIIITDKEKLKERKQNKV